MLGPRKTGPVRGRHIAFAVFVIVIAVLPGLTRDHLRQVKFLVFPPSAEEVEQAEQVVETALNTPWPNSRFDEQNATVSACKVLTYQHDQECRYENDLQTFHEFADLKALKLELRDNNRAHEGVYYIGALLSPRPGLEEKMRRIKSRSSALLTQAQLDVGRGPQAAALHGEWFGREFDEASLPMWRRVKTCNEYEYFKVGDGSLPLIVPDLDAADQVRWAAVVLERHCARQN